MKFRSLIFATAFLTIFSATSALAGEWHKVGTFTAGGDAKEMAVNRNCSTCLIKVTDGSVVINTVVIREGDKKTPKTVGRRIEKGDQAEIQVGDKLYVTGFRISDDGRGTYLVYVKN